MKNTFVVEQKAFLSIISSMQPICTKRTTLNATATIFFQVGIKELVLKCTDLEISLQASYLLKESTIEDQQSFLVSGRRLFDLVKELDGDIRFSIEGNRLLLNTGSVSVSLHIQNAQDFPPFPERIENIMSFETDFLLDVLTKVSFLIPQNNANPALNGLFVELSPQEVRMTATDGHCLVQARSESYTLEEEKKWLLPRRAAFELKKILEGALDKQVFLGLCGNQLVFSGEYFNFFTRLLADPFPEYTSILKKEGFVPAQVDKAHFIKTLRRSSCLLSGQFIATEFSFTQNSIRVAMQNKEVGSLEEHIPLTQFEGTELDLRFYAPYLLSGLQVFPHDQIQLHLKNASKPIIFEAQVSLYHLLYLVMPVAPTNNT